MDNLYESDFYQWVQRQKQLLASQQFDQLDLKNLIEEVDEMGKSEYKSLRSHLTHLLSHCLKWYYQPEKRETGYSWQYTIVEQRKMVARVLRESPSLKHKLDDLYLEAYEYGRIEATKETLLPEATFPVECPWSFEQVMVEGWLPTD